MLTREVRESSDKIMLNEVEEIEEKWEKYKTKRRGSYKKKKYFYNLFCSINSSNLHW